MIRFGVFLSREAIRTNLLFLKFELTGIVDGLDVKW